MAFFPGTASSGSKKPCKYGPRDSDGFCPKAPKKPKKARAKKPCKYGPRDADGYCPKKPSSSPWKNAEEVVVAKVTGKSSTARAKAKSPQQRNVEKAVTKVAEKVTETALAKLAKKVEQNPEWSTAAAGLAGTKVSQIGKLKGAVAVASLSGVLLAGIAAYAATTYIITRSARNKEQRQQQAFEAAQAYRQARQLAAVQKGKALTAAELKTLANEYRRQLKALGISATGVKL